MRRVQVSLKTATDHSYDVEIERGILRRVASDLRTKRFAEQYVMITDKTVHRYLGSPLTTSLKREKLLLGKIVIPAGEQSKTFSELEKILSSMMSFGANRNTGVIALGGGMVGDLAGFAAASFMRGIPLLQVPTTLLAMVDSSVGGKVGVDLSSGKNMAGAFWQPKKVYIDPDCLSSLPSRQWRSGLAEAVKYAAIKDRSLWDFFEKHLKVFKKETKKLLPSEWTLVEEMIQRCLQMKAEVVMKDEQESNLRKILNYGHTFGHVIELMSEYTVLHGEAVATGMRLAAAVAVKLRYMPSAEMEKQNALLDELGIKRVKTKGLIKDFLHSMRRDKKSKGDLRLVLVDRLGRCRQDLGKYTTKVDERIVQEVLEESGLIDNRSKSTPTVQEPWSSSASSAPPHPAYAPYTSPYSSSSGPSFYAQPVSGETELQRRLREMRERREKAQREGGSWLPG